MKIPVIWHLSVFIGGLLSNLWNWTEVWRVIQGGSLVAIARPTTQPPMEDFPPPPPLKAFTFCLDRHRTVEALLVAAITLAISTFVFRSLHNSLFAVPV